MSILICYVLPSVNIQFAFSGRKSFFLLLELSGYLYLLLCVSMTVSLTNGMNIPKLYYLTYGGPCIPHKAATETKMKSNALPQ